MLLNGEYKSSVSVNQWGNLRRYIFCTGVYGLLIIHGSSTTGRKFAILNQTTMMLVLTSQYKTGPDGA